MNFKLGAQGGSLAGASSGLGFGSFAAPLGHSFGLQVDGGAGSVDSKAYWGTGSHLFWRDPSIGLLGLTYSYQHWNDVDFGYINNSNASVVKDAYMHKAGLEGDVYLSRFTVGGRGGYQGGTVNSDGYGQLKLRYYATDNWSVQVTGDHFAGQNLIRGGMEFKPNFEVLSGLSLFAEGGYGTHDYGMGQAGIRYYFGKQASLIGRDRRSDPEMLVPDDSNAFIQQIKSMHNGQTPGTSTVVASPRGNTITSGVETTRLGPITTYYGGADTTNVNFGTGLTSVDATSSGAGGTMTTIPIQTINQVAP